MSPAPARASAVPLGALCSGSFNQGLGETSSYVSCVGAKQPENGPGDGKDRGRLANSRSA